MLRHPRKTMWVQGNCKSPPPPEFNVKSYRAAQCVLLLRAGLLSTLPAHAGTLWLDNLHFRSARPAADPAFYLMSSCATDTFKMWLTNCTFQGDGIGRNGIRGYGLAAGCRTFMSGVPLQHHLCASAVHLSVHAQHCLICVGSSNVADMTLNGVKVLSRTFMVGEEPEIVLYPAYAIMVGRCRTQC